MPISSRLIMIYALLWATGLALLWWPIVLMRLVSRRHLLGRPPFMLECVLLLLGASLLVPVLTLEDGNRVPGALFNLVVWLCVALICSASDPIRQAHALKVGLVNLATIQATVVLLAYLVPAIRTLPLGIAAALPEGLAGEPSLAAFASNRLVIPDYFQGAVLRAGGMFGNPTWAAGLTAVSLILVALDRRLRSLVRRPVLCFIIAFQGATLWLTYSRASLLGVGAAVVIGALWMPGPRRQLARTLGVLFATVMAFGMYQAGDAVTQQVVAINDQRAGSLISRTEIYAATLERVDLPPGLVIGKGVKARGDGLVASFGSHSTYLGLAYRGGVAAALAYVAWMGTILVRAIRQRNGVAVGLIGFIALWSLVEDVDTGHLGVLALACAYLLVAAQQRRTARLL